MLLYSQLKIMCGSIESLQYALSTLLQLLVLYQMEEDISVPTLLVRIHLTAFDQQ